MALSRQYIEKTLHGIAVAYLLAENWQWDAKALNHIAANCGNIAQLNVFPFLLLDLKFSGKLNEWRKVFNDCSTPAQMWFTCCEISSEDYEYYSTRQSLNIAALNEVKLIVMGWFKEQHPELVKLVTEKTTHVEFLMTPKNSSDALFAALFKFLGASSAGDSSGHWDIKQEGILETRAKINLVDRVVYIHSRDFGYHFEPTSERAMDTLRHETDVANPVTKDMVKGFTGEVARILEYKPETRYYQVVVGNTYLLSYYHLRFTRDTPATKDLYSQLSWVLPKEADRLENMPLKDALAYPRHKLVLEANPQHAATRYYRVLIIDQVKPVETLFFTTGLPSKVVG